jgi:hypothetical protein|tara:strand:+ start:237 stop:431 length:195 start_codon:yes stop_codon:yes gene_type:complete
MSEVKLTSVKVISELYKKFKNETIESEFSLQKLVNRTLDRFVYEEDFRKEILEHENLHQSGSKF